MIPTFNALSLTDPVKADAVNRLSSGIKTSIDAVASIPMLDGLLLASVSLSVGDNTIPHKLGRVLQGWRIERIRAASTIFDKQDANLTPSATLVLNASAAVVVDLWVY